MQGFTNGNWRQVFAHIQPSGDLRCSRFAVPGGMATFVNESDLTIANTAIQEICRSLASNLAVSSDRHIDR
jgi:hypothetical protein